MVFLFRHASTNDVILGPYILGHKLGFNLRMVMKSELLWDPFIEASGTRCDNYFINRSNKTNMDIEVQGVANLVKQPYEDDDGRMKAVCIYPEGTRMTEAKKKSILESMQRNSSPMYDYAKR